MIASKDFTSCRSQLSDCVLHVTGFAPLLPGWEVARLPAFDTRHELFARLTYADAVLFAAANGGRLMREAEVDRLWAIGKRIKPVVVRETSAEAEARREKGLDDTHALDHMSTVAWAVRHDAHLWMQLHDWDGAMPVANAGKMWGADAPAGRALNIGWNTGEGWMLLTDKELRQPARPGRLQNAGRTHNRGHYDYSQLLQMVRRVAA